MTSSTHTYDQSKKLTKNAYKKKGYIFQGWSKVKDGAVSPLEWEHMMQH